MTYVNAFCKSYLSLITKQALNNNNTTCLEQQQHNITDSRKGSVE